MVRKRDDPSPITPSAAEAKRRSQEQVLEDYRRWGQVRPLAQVLRKHRLENHLSERMQQGWRDAR